MNSTGKKTTNQKHAYQPVQDDEFKQKLKEKFGQNIIYQNPNRYLQMKDFNQRNPSYGVTVEYNFLLKIQDCGLLESSQLQFFMNLFRKAYSDVKLAAASCYFFGDLIVTSSQAIQPQQQPIIIKLDWKRPNVEEKPQELNKIKEPPKTTIEKELQSKQNMQSQNKQNSEVNQQLSKNNNNIFEIEQNQQQNYHNSKKKQPQPPNSEIKLHNDPKQEPPHSEIPSHNLPKQQPPTTQEILSKPQMQQPPCSEIILPKSTMPQTTNSQERVNNPQKQETPNKQTKLSNPSQQQPSNSQEMQNDSPKQQSTDSGETLSNSQKQQKEYQQPLQKQTQILKQEQHQQDQIKKQDDEKNNKSLQPNQSDQKQQVIGQVNQETEKNHTQDQKQTNSNSQIITSQEGSTEQRIQNDSISKKCVEKKKKNFQVIENQQNSNQVAVNQDFQVEADQNKSTVQQNQKEVPIVQAPAQQVQAQPIKQDQAQSVKQVQAQPVKQVQAQPINQKPVNEKFHFQITSQVIEQKPSKEILQKSQLGLLIKQFAEINNLSEDQLKNQDYWFFPINQQQTHWISAVVQFKPKLIYYFDSYYEKIDPLIINGIHAILDYYNLNPKDFNVIPFYNQQENCYDCGIFLLLSLLYTLRKKNYDYNQKLINKYRESILYKLAVIGAQVEIEKDFLEELIR